MTDQLEYALTRTRQVLLEPKFPEDELAKLKNQMVSELAVARENPNTVASLEMNKLLFGGTPLGKEVTPESVTGITLGDVKQYYKQIYQPADAILVIAGDVDFEQGQKLAEKLLDGWKTADLPDVNYSLPKVESRKIILVDNPAGKQSVLRLGVRAYNNRNDDRFAGSVAGQVLSSGIESRLGRYVRAQKGYAYGVTAYFIPTRQAGSFSGSTETAFDTTVETVQAMFKVFEDLRKENITADELATATTRVAGRLLMETQTIDQQADRRVEAILNGYPPDYYDKLPARISKVTADEVRSVMNRYVHDDQLQIVVVAPAEKVKEKLSQLGEVQVLPMPAKRSGAATTQAGEMLK